MKNNFVRKKIFFEKILFIPVSRNEGFESDYKKKNIMCVCECVCVCVCVCNKYCKIKENKNKKRQFSTCHIVYMMGLYDVFFKSSCCAYILMWRREKNSIQTKYLEFMQTDIRSIIWDYGKVYEQYSEFIWTEIHSIIRDYGKIFGIYADRDTFLYPGNFHPYVQPV